MRIKQVIIAGTVCGLLGLAGPALASGHRVTHRRALVMAVRKHKSVFLGHAARAAVLSSSGAHVAYWGYSCEATVGVGHRGKQAQNVYTTDSTEFYFAYRGGRKYSVSSNCIGMLPSGTIHANHTVNHAVACKQYNPFNISKPTIQGYGISTTYADGLFSETCNTPNFK